MSKPPFQKLHGAKKALVIATTICTFATLPLAAQEAATNFLDVLSVQQRLQSGGSGGQLLPQPVNLVIEDVGGSFRIASAGKLRMLSQRTTMAASNYVAGVAPEETLVIFTKAKAEFRLILNALVKGDESIGIIGPESQRRTLEAVARVEALFAPFEAALDGILAGTDIDKNIAYIAENNDALLAEANVLTSEVSAAYSNPAEMTQAAAMHVDISARQRMLTQRIAKQAAGVAIGNKALGSVEGLAKTMALYETSLNALLNGMPEAGINPPPTEELRLKLTEAVVGWSKTKVVLDQLIQTGTASNATQVEIMNLMNAELDKMIVIAKLYTEHAKTRI